MAFIIAHQPNLLTQKKGEIREILFTVDCIFNAQVLINAPLDLKKNNAL